jgi:hypothetical protein
MSDWNLRQASTSWYSSHIRCALISTRRKATGSGRIRLAASGFEEARKLFTRPYWLDQRSDSSQALSPKCSARRNRSGAGNPHGCGLIRVPPQRRPPLTPRPPIVLDHESAEQFDALPDSETRLGATSCGQAPSPHRCRRRSDLRQGRYMRTLAGFEARGKRKSKIAKNQQFPSDPNPGDCKNRDA